MGGLQVLLQEEGGLQEEGDGGGEEGGVSELPLWLGHHMTPPLVEGAVMVFSDMALALLSVVVNLMVINSLREREGLLGFTHNLVRYVLYTVYCQHHDDQLLEGEEGDAGVHTQPG